MEKKMNVVVFTNMGRTYQFEDVTEFKHSTQGFSFWYMGVSTGVKRYANFNNTCVAGYALSEE